MGVMLKTPVALIIFRRPEPTAQVLTAIAQVRPQKLFVIADGPRPGRPTDEARCAAARAVVDRVDWDCEVIKNYSATNLGCGHRPATGISWVFDQVDEAIVLEDDCVPHPSFFRFCEELLERYREDERVMHITGSTYRPEPLKTPYSYFFSHFNCPWGWASWRRAWKHYDLTLKLWPQLRDTSWLNDILEDESVIPYWGPYFARAHERQGDVDYWDYQWTFACWANSGLSIMPCANLVSNVGVGADSTNFGGDSDPMCHMPVHEMKFPLAHPSSVLRRADLDREFLQEVILPRFLPHVPPSRLRLLASRLSPSFIKRQYRRLASILGPPTPRKRQEPA